MSEGNYIENERSPARPSRAEPLWEDRHHLSVVDEADAFFVYNETSALHRPLQKLDGDAVVAHCGHFSGELPVAQLGDDEIADDRPVTRGRTVVWLVDILRAIQLDRRFLAVVVRLQHRLDGISARTGRDALGHPAQEMFLR